MGVFSRSWSLVSSSWGVLRDDKELILLPVLSAIASMALMAPFIGIAIMTSIGSTAAGAGAGDSSFQIGIPGYVALFVGYLLSAYATIFFQSAVVLAANERLEGGDPSLGSALAAAGENAGRILPWALITATVSMIINAIQERAGFLGSLVAGLAGVAWALVTMLVLPILVIEHVGVTDAIKRSSAAFKQTWGVNIVANGGIGLISFLAMLAGASVGLPIAIGGFSAGIPVLGVAGVVALLSWIVIVAAVSSALSGVFRTALYRYAVLGVESPGFTQAQIDQAFRTRRRRGRRTI